MPQLGETQQGHKIGYKSNQKYIWSACQRCKKERWVQLYKEKTQSISRSILCRRCHHPKWEAGFKKSDGYIFIRLHPDEFFYPMANKNGTVLAHRLIVAKALGRCLLSWEVVHHKGTKHPKGSIENKSDNRYPENLQLLPSDKSHIIDRVSRSHIARLEKRVTILEAENILLREQIKLSEGIYEK